MDVAIAKSDIDAFYAHLARSPPDTIRLQLMLKLAATTCIATSDLRRHQGTFRRAVHILCVLCEQCPHARLECVFDPYEPPIVSSLSSYLVAMYARYPHYARDVQVAAVLRHIPLHQADLSEDALPWAAEWGMERTTPVLLHAHGARFYPGMVQIAARGRWAVLWRLAHLAPLYGLDVANGNADALLHALLDLHQLIVVDRCPLKRALRAMRMRQGGELPPGHKGQHPLSAMLITLVEQYGIDIERTSVEGHTARYYVNRICLACVEEGPEIFQSLRSMLFAYEFDRWAQRVRMVTLAARRPACPIARLGEDMLRRILESIRPY